jgi:Xaa-Pro aminopeptidase
MLLTVPSLRLPLIASFRSVTNKVPVYLPTRAFSNTVIRSSLDMETVDTSGRLAKLRQLMQQHHVDVYGGLQFKLWTLR